MKSYYRVISLSGIVTAVLLLVTGINVNAQKGNRCGRSGELPDSAGVIMHVDRLAADLSLTEEQKVAVLELEQAHFAEMKVQREAMGERREAHRELMEKERLAHLEQMKTILTAEQYDQWLETHQQQVRQRRHDGSGQGYGRGGRCAKGDGRGGRYGRQN